MKTINDATLALLRAPFPANAIVWRVGATNEDKTRGKALPYLNARLVQDRLDSVVGADKWDNKFVEVIANGKVTAVRCTLGIKTEDGWVYKEDAAQLDEARTTGNAERDDYERSLAVKGVYSDALKRAAVQWGIGRYLYAYDAPWVSLTTAGTLGTPPTLPDDLLPEEERGKGAAKQSAAADKGSADASASAKSEQAQQTPQPQSKATSTPAQASSPAPSPAPAPTPAQAPAPAAEVDEDEQRNRDRASALADAAVSKSSAPAPAADAPAQSGSALPPEELKLARELLEKTLKLPMQILKTYIEGPKTEGKLQPATRAALVAALEGIYQADPAARQQVVNAKVAAL